MCSKNIIYGKTERFLVSTVTYSTTLASRPQNTWKLSFLECKITIWFRHGKLTKIQIPR